MDRFGTCLTKRFASEFSTMSTEGHTPLCLGEPGEIELGVVWPLFSMLGMSWWKRPFNVVSCKQSINLSMKQSINGFIQSFVFFCLMGECLLGTYASEFVKA